MRSHAVTGRPRRFVPARSGETPRQMLTHEHMRQRQCVPSVLLVRKLLTRDALIH